MNAQTLDGSFVSSGENILGWGLLPDVLRLGLGVRPDGLTTLGFILVCLLSPDPMSDVFGNKLCRLLGSISSY
jgi:hypothetical protein